MCLLSFGFCTIPSEVLNCGEVIIIIMTPVFHIRLIKLLLKTWLQTNVNDVRHYLQVFCGKSSVDEKMLLIVVLYFTRSS